jgi:hypothetical protein
VHLYLFCADGRNELRPYEKNEKWILD